MTTVLHVHVLQVHVCANKVLTVIKYNKLRLKELSNATQPDTPTGTLKGPIWDATWDQ